MIMVNQNTKHTRKKRLSKSNKQKLAKKLESSVANISKRGIYFKAKTKNNTYNIIDGANKKVVLEDVLLPESANTILNTLKQANKQKIPKIIERFNYTLRTYQPNIEKQLNDIMFYRHTMKTTKDSIKFFSTEARIDIAVSKLRFERDTLQDRLGINVLHSSYLD